MEFGLQRFQRQPERTVLHSDVTCCALLITESLQLAFLTNRKRYNTNMLTYTACQGAGPQHSPHGCPLLAQERRTDGP